MIISPPFLPARTDGQSEDAWLDAAMAPTAILASTRAPEGSFPLSGNLAWHNGIHIQAPASSTDALKVRAIADGIVRFVQAPTKPNSTLTDPQNFNPFGRDGAVNSTPAWTDNGCVIIEHTSSIGAVGATETTVVFYSLYMHLSQLSKNAAGRPWAAGDHVWRKDQIGLPGQIYGHSQQIHFEICFNANQFEALTGRAPNWVAPPVAPAVLPAPTADGRTDSIFGSMYFYLPASTPTHVGTTAPTNHLRAAAGGTTLQTPMWVKMTYERGSCTFESFDVRGASIRALPAETGIEYTLSAEARVRHSSLSVVNRAESSASGWFELLRFGRNVGRGDATIDKDRLPSQAAHWRRIAGPDGRAVWTDLNGAGSFKFSDADFPAVIGWNCFDDDTSPEDQRCDSAHLKEVIRDPDTSNANRMQTEQLLQRLGHAEVRAKLRKTICKFPSEWDKDTIATRYSFLKELESFKRAPDAWAEQEAHLKAISFTGLPPGYLAATWRMHPREFIGVMRRCGWLDRPSLGRIYRSTSEAVRERYRISLNQVTRRYLYIGDPLRLSHFLGQGAIESTYLRTMQEASMLGKIDGKNFYGTSLNQTSLTNESQLGHWYGSIPSEDDAWFRSTKYNSHGGLIASSYNWRNGNLGDPDAQKFRGRGFKQLTGLLNYSKYWVFRGWLDSSSFADSWWTDPNYRNHDEQHMTLIPPVVNDPEQATATPYNCMDTGGWFLGSERPDTLRQIDRDNHNLAISPEAIASERNISYSVTLAINGGGIQREDRLRETRVAKSVLL